jgi:leader peptidase (prepilin peptidase)/N-methyltransferase
MFLFLLLVVSKGRAIGGGDVKLMAAAGLLLGWKNIILAFLLGCIIGSVIHLLRMKLSGADHVLAMGPYLSVGIAVAALWGDTLINWYISLL